MDAQWILRLAEDDSSTRAVKQLRVAVKLFIHITIWFIFTSNQPQTAARISVYAAWICTQLTVAPSLSTKSCIPLHTAQSVRKHSLIFPPRFGRPLVLVPVHHRPPHEFPTSPLRRSTSTWNVPHPNWIPRTSSFLSWYSFRTKLWLFYLQSNRKMKKISSMRPRRNVSPSN